MPTMASSLERLAFKVHEEPVFTASGKETGHKAVVRDDNGKVLAVNTDSYGLIPYQETLVPQIHSMLSLGWELAPDAGRYGVRRPAVRIERDGRRAYVELINPQMQAVVGKDDALVPRLVVMGSYDASSAHRLRAGAFRLVCSNGLTIAVGPQFKASVRHLGEGAEDKAERLTLLAGQFIANYNSLSEQWRKMEAEHPLEKTIEKALVESLGLRRGTEHKGRLPKNPSAWQVYNVVTQTLTYDFKGSEDLRERKDRRARDILMGLEG